MIKNFFLFFWALALFATLSKAQVSSVTGQYLQDNNLLLNPGFESGIGKWTNSAGTFTADYSVFVQGKASGKVVLSSQALDFFQDSTLFASQLADGMQAILTVKIKSSVEGVKVCPKQAGSVITSLCIDVQGNNKWSLYQIPFVTGATSQGISINSNSTSITGTVYIDESYVGVTNILNSSSEAKLAGEAYFAGTSGCIWSRSSSTIGAFTATTACPGPTIVEQNLGQWQTTDSDLPRVTINNLPAGKYKAKFIVPMDTSNGNTSAIAINDGTTTCEAVQSNNILGTVVGQIVECTFSYVSSGNRVFEMYGASALNSIRIQNATSSASITPRSSTKFILEYYGSNSTYTTLNADTDWASCNFSTLAWQGLGTVTNALECKRQGGDLLIKGRFTTGTVSAVEARMNLPTWNGVQLLSAGIQKIPVIQLAGSPLIFNAPNSSFFVPLIEPSVSYITFGLQASITNAGLTKVTGSALTGSSVVQSINARIPIEGWQNSNIIIGQFNGLESCTDSYECTDVFSANVSSGGTVSNENIDWINGNISPSSNLYPISFKTGVFTVAPNCVATATSTSIVTIQEYTAATNSGVTMATVAGGAGSPQAFKIVCQKQGVDYIGKTAKAVASDQNVASPGTIKSTLCSAKISSTGVITDQKGGCFASCTNATTPVCTFTSSYWVAGQIPNCWGITDTAGTSTGNATTASSTELAVRVIDSTFATVSGARRYFCHGERQ